MGKRNNMLHDGYLEESWINPRSNGEIICLNHFFVVFKNPRSGGETIEPNITLTAALLGGFAAFLLAPR